MENRINRYAVKVAEGKTTATPAAALAPSGMSNNTKETIARMAITGGGGALGGVLLGWLLGHNKKQLARNAALFGAVGLGAGEGLNWYAHQRDTEKPDVLDKAMEKSGAFGKALGSVVPTSWNQTGKALKDMAKVNPLTHWITGIADTGSIGLLLDKHFNKNLLTKGNVREVTAHRMKGIEAGVQKAQQLVVDNLGQDTWNRLIGGHSNATDKQNVAALFNKQADPAAHKQMVDIAKGRAASQSKGTINPTLQRNVTRDAAAAETLTGNWTAKGAQLLKERLRAAPDAKSRQAISAEINPEFAKFMNPPKNGKGGKPQPKPTAFAPDELSPHVDAATSTLAPNVKRGGNRWSTDRLSRLKNYVADPGGQGYAQPGSVRGYGLDADDTRFGAKRVGQFRRNPVRGAVGLSSISRLINVILDRYKANQEPL